MRLKQIKLAGFKSFVDPTTAGFPTNLAAVVGPNGCGKSNIIDAVRWVMGESSAKNLRGESMTDVIFNGSSARKPVGQASIELVFDNSDGTLGGEYATYAEISIKRLVTRDAKSDYFLNGVRCRRKDITDIFLGTGLGPRSYAIIEQGMISRLIDAKPEELRIYIEEAAGISRYKERRRETENRMRHTRENLDRLNDLREELERQLAHLQRQAHSAEKYREYKDEERLLKAQLMGLRWQRFDRELTEKETGVRDLEVRMESVIADYRACENLMEQKRAEHIEQNDVFNEVQGRFYKVGTEIARIEQNMQHERQRRDQLNQDLRQIEQSQRQADDNAALDRARIEELEAVLMELEPEKAMLEERHALSQGELSEREQALQDWQQQWDGFNQDASGNRQKAEVEQSRIRHLEQSIQRLRDRIQRLEQERQNLNADPLAAELAELSERVAEFDLTVEAQQETLERVQSEVVQRREDNARVSSELDGLRTRQQTLMGRKASLEALQQAAESGQQQVQGWLSQNGLTASQRIMDAMQVQVGWEKAVETVLGDSLQAVSVAALDDYAARLDSFTAGALVLVEDNSGASVLTSASADVHSLAAQVQGPAQVLRWLSTVRTAASLEEALAIRSTLAEGESVITPEGVWLGASWLRVSHEHDAGSGVLERRRELESIAVELADVEERLQTLSEALQHSRERMRELEQQREQAQRELSRVSRERGDVQAQLMARQVRLEQFTARRERLSQEMQEVQEQQVQEQEHLGEARLVLQDALDGMSDDVAHREAMLRQRDEINMMLNDLRQRARADRDAAHDVALKLQSMRTELSSLKVALSRLDAQQAELEARATQSREMLAELDMPGDEQRELLESLLAQRLTVEEELRTLRNRLEGIDTELREADRRRHQADQQAQEQRARLDALRLSLQSLVVQRQTVEEQAQEAEFDLPTVIQTLVAEANEQQTQEDLERVAQRILRLGPINLAAIDEYKAQSERKTYLDAQNADLTEALETLENAIRKIDRETRTLFKNTFDLINKGLQELFPKVFGGGHAYLELTGEDLLETGVTIMARPPGKRNSTIHLLSGGEKALTALSLVFSIFRLNPAPFCMLDEVDAPLDDANVGRFCRLVQEMSGKVQFIYITHNKVAMEMAQQLMGVTMHEPGVSRLVSVNVEEAAALAAV